MREHDALYCYYEVCNEALASLTSEEAVSAGSADWRSRHPEVESYREEYLPLIKGHGIPGFPEAGDNDNRFISEAGLKGSLDEDVQRYLQTLVDHARSQGKTPVLSGQRMLGRSHGIREAFPGFHILLVRNLFHQWNSYSGQFRTGNPYFLWTLHRTLVLASRDPFIAYLTSIFDDAALVSQEKWMASENSDNLFCYFVAFHIYFYLETLPNVDLVIDSTRLAEPDGVYLQRMQRELGAGVGLEIDLSNVRTAIDLPCFPIWQPALCRNRIEELVESAHSIRRSTIEERKFADGMLADLWYEWERFELYSKSARERIRDVEAQLATSVNALEIARASFSDTEAKLGEMREAVAREETANQVLREQVERQRMVSVQRDRDLARLYERLADQQAQRVAADQRATYLEADKGKLAEELARNQAKISRLVRGREEHVIERSRLEGELVAMRAGIRKIEEDFTQRLAGVVDEERSRAADQLKRVVDDFNAERAELVKEITQGAEQKAALDNILSRHVRDLAVSEQGYAAAALACDQLKEKVRHLDEDISAADAKYRQAILERDEIRARWDQLTVTLTSGEVPRALRWVLPLARWLRPFAGEADHSSRRRG